jgi:hypothetical protein
LTLHLPALRSGPEEPLAELKVILLDDTADDLAGSLARLHRSAAKARPHHLLAPVDLPWPAHASPATDYTCWRIRDGGILVQFDLLPSRAALETGERQPLVIELSDDDAAALADALRRTLDPEGAHPAE